MAVPDSPPVSPPASMRSPELQTESMLHDTIPYSAAFSNSIMRVVLQPPPSPTGITLVAKSSADLKNMYRFTALADVNSSSLPQIEASSLPLSLNDPHRIYTSSLRGVDLTHPGGWLEGGPGSGPLPRIQDLPSEEAETYLNRHSIKTLEQLRQQIDRDVVLQIEELKERMRKREEAVKENEEVERKMEALIEQRKLERKIEQRMRKEMWGKRDEGE